MTVLVFGKTGQIARELQRYSDVVTLNRQDADLRDAGACAAAIHAHSPRAVINAAAYTAVDRAEDEEPLANLINAQAPTAMAQACAVLDIPFVTISTDYVFDGLGHAPFRPSDATGPLGAYGRTKLAGENGVRASGGRFAILRTSWVFSAHGSNFVKTMLRFGADRSHVTVVADQIGGPAFAGDIAAACLTMADALGGTDPPCGIYHYSGAPDVSWADVAVEVFKQANLPCAVKRITSAQYPTRAVRPLNSRMDCTSTQVAFGLTRPNWRRGLDQVVGDLSKGENNEDHSKATQRDHFGGRIGHAALSDHHRRVQAAAADLR